ncbi:glycosyl transferase [Pilimelia terevasa]|uniref:Glycosyl transferase n=1 Tax=Pilimelia terevasa TaxID=53372 RepID=A0A8J3BNQ2_9ACTN|nr:glycosyltransferase family 4 protein [Pilimelia terevasa]GGK16888.1 glycosyl transferase [Pilimelia terevasa]
MSGANDSPLRIALVVPPYFDVPPAAYGGVEAVVADLADALVARGHRVVLIGAGRPGTSAEFLPVWDRTIPERLGEPFPELVHAAVTRRAVEHLVLRDGLDVVHDHTMSGPLNAPAYAALGLPTVVTMHGPVDSDLHRYYRSLGTDIDIVAISDRQRAMAPDLNWAGTVHNALTLETWPFEESKDDYALFLGRFHPTKAPHLAVEAAHAAGVPLILAGKCAEAPELAYFHAEVEPRLRDTDSVFGVADATAKRALLAHARCLLFPIQWEEPFGMVMIEAMACGTPVVALRGGAVPEVLVDGETGFIVDDPADLSAAMARVGEIDPAACRARVAAHFSVDRLAHGYEAAYRTALARREALHSATDLATLTTELDALDTLTAASPAAPRRRPTRSV